MVSREKTNAYYKTGHRFKIQRLYES